MKAIQSNPIFVPGQSVDSKAGGCGAGLWTTIAKRQPSSRVARVGGALLAVAMAALIGARPAQSQLVGAGNGLAFELKNPQPTTQLPSDLSARVTVLPFRNAP